MQKFQESDWETHRNITVQLGDFELVLLLGDFKSTSKVVFLLLQLLWDEFEMS